MKAHPTHRSCSTVGGLLDLSAPQLVACDQQLALHGRATAVGMIRHVEARVERKARTLATLSPCARHKLMRNIRDAPFTGVPRHAFYRLRIYSWRRALLRGVLYYLYLLTKRFMKLSDIAVSVKHSPYLGT